MGDLVHAINFIFRYKRYSIKQLLLLIRAGVATGDVSIQNAINYLKIFTKTKMVDLQSLLVSDSDSAFKRLGL